MSARAVQALALELLRANERAARYRRKFHEVNRLDAERVAKAIGEQSLVRETKARIASGVQEAFRELRSRPLRIPEDLHDLELRILDMVENR